MRGIAQIISLCLGICAAFPSDVAVDRPIYTNSIQRFAQAQDQDSKGSEVRALKKVFLSNRSITCNDGSQAGFYLRKSHTSKKWIIFLEGGWYCYDHNSCRNRWLRQRHYMTSSQWPDTRDVGGILSPKVEENPFWWNLNHVFVPYCTSDSWSGSKVASPDQMFSFMGSSVVLQVVKDLIPLGLENSTDLLLAGSSAGGTGVMINLDYVQEYLHDQMLLKQIHVSGVTDSGWFLDRTPYAPTNKPAVDAIRKGMEMWQGKVPRRCREEYLSEPWRCYFGYRLYPTLNSELFVFQWLFDEAQMDADNVGAPVSKQQWDYIHKMGDALRQSFQNVSAVFAPACISHSVLTKKDWQNVKIDDISIAEALHCWEHKNARKRLKRLKNDNMLADQPNFMNRRKRKRNGGHLENSLTSNHSNNNKNGADGSNKRKRRRKHRKNKKGKKRKDTLRENQTNHNRTTPVISNTVNSSDKRSSRSTLHGQKKPKCTHRRMERCSWPQCNHSCPRLRNPVTGDEIGFLDLLKSFGLDMESVAKALGIDMQTLNNMEQSELLNLLTQQSN